MRIRITCIITITIFVLSMIACERQPKKGGELSKQDKDYIKTLGLLEEQENIILFDSQSGLTGVETSGNFFTNKRIASYWIDDRDKEKTKIEHALYTEIDTIRRYPKYNSVTLASYLEVQRKDGTKFRVYVDADSVRTWNFFNQAMEQWTSKNSR